MEGSWKNNADLLLDSVKQVTDFLQAKKGQKEREIEFYDLHLTRRSHW